MLIKHLPGARAAAPPIHSACRVSLINSCRTFDREADFLGDPLPLGVEDVAGVAPAVRPGHPLHHEALVADDDAAPHVVVESLALQQESVRGIWSQCTLGECQYGTFVLSALRYLMVLGFCNINLLIYHMPKENQLWTGNIDRSFVQSLALHHHYALDENW